MSTLPPSLPRTPRLPVSLGMSSFAIGTVGLLLAFFPVLGVPISAFGLLLGLVGLVTSWRPGGVLLRWSLIGVGVSAAALAVNVAVTYAPHGYKPQPEPPAPWQPVPDKPYVSPPEP
jgi:hypothetical protein